MSIASPPHKLAAAVGLAAALLAATACSDDNTITRGTLTTTPGTLTAPSDPAAPPTSPVTTDESSTSKPDESSTSKPDESSTSEPDDNSSTTEPTEGGSDTSAPDESTTSTQPTTPTTPTTEKPLPTDWADYSRTPSMIVALPCCGSNFAGVASPPFPESGTTLADGDYYVTGRIAKDPSSPIKLTVRRLEACSALPAGSCEDGWEQDPTALGIDKSASMKLDFPLDASTGVIYTGWKTETVKGTGADLAAMATNLKASYAATISPLTKTTSDYEQLRQAIADNPANGWEAVDGSEGGLWAWTDGSSPKVLVQSPPEQRATDLLGLVSLHVEAGTPYLVVYAGFYS